MCGIAGYVSRSASRTPVQRMLAAMAHRGPDDEGLWANDSGTAVLGNRRLSIIDLSAAGHMPMADPSGQVWITYNGELYGCAGLRQELEEAGYAFRSHSDTEIVLAAWMTWGPSFLDRLTGMFALAIYDGRDPEDPIFLLARDRLGIKPVYWMPTDGGILFASEIKVLLASDIVPRRADRQAIWDYLSLGSVRGPRTIIEGVQSLPPAHVLEIRNGRLEQRRYWSLPSPRLAADAAPVEAARALRRLLEDVVAQHMVADVPVGAFLSGGIDSTTLVALAAAHAGGPLKTFTVKFGQNPAAEDEALHSAMMAAHVGADHTEVYVPAEAIAEHFPDIIASMDQPSVDGVNSWFVSRATSESVTVALSGLGSDEIFAGYPHFRRFTQVARFLPTGAPSIERMADHPTFLPSRLRRGAKFLGGDSSVRHLQVREIFPPAAKAQLSGSFRGQPTEAGYVVSPPDETDTVNAVSRAEIQGYLVDTLLRDADAMSMAHSLEVRVPFIDHRVVEHALGLPGSLKLRGREGKAILRDAVRDLLPAEILDRPKSYFSMPLHEWAAGALQPRIVEFLHSPSLREMLDQGQIQELQESMSSQGTRSWAIAILGGWLESHEVIV